MPHTVSVTVTLVDLCSLWIDEEPARFQENGTAQQSETFGSASAAVMHCALLSVIHRVAVSINLQSAAVVASLALTTTTFSSPTVKRILGGEPAKPGELPFLVKFDGRFVCSGFLIGPRTILTAAHCLKPQRPMWSTAEVTGMVFRSDEITKVMHPKYKNHTNDIGLVFLPRTVPGPYPQISGDYPQPNSKIVAAGFGHIDNNNTLPRSLQKAELTVENKAVCLLHYPNFVDDTQFCTKDTPQGVCNGDSGGPLFIGENESIKIVGVTSHGTPSYGCGEKGNYQYFTFVHPYMQWINEEIARFEKNETVSTF
ncbi:hypothetical protein EC968_001715 [Mortierella alpina]|nr:hypothetical protein EC968_001715 [Mortierella alpina]